MTNAKHVELLEQAKVHFEMDMLLKGTYGRTNDAGDFRGCSVGCHLSHINPGMSPVDIDHLIDKHKHVADYYEYPEWLALLQDTVFEGLPNGESAKWHVQLAEAIAARNGAIDWQETLHRVHVGILRISYNTAGTAQEVVQSVIDLHERAAAGEAIGDELWSAARSAAWSAAESAAESAARSAARSAAWSAAESAAWSAAESAAESAAWSAAESAAESAARSAAFQEIRDAILDAIANKSANA
jgi:hypothetical protein